jgi:hypothetical protein
VAHISITTANASAPNLRLIVEHNVQQGTVDFDAAVVIDQAQFSKFVHEKTHARPGRSDHLRKRLLADFCYDRLRPTFLAEIRQQQKSPRQTFLARIEELIDQVLLDTTVAGQEMRNE